MKKPVYKHPSFVIRTYHYRTEEKRFWLSLTFDKIGNDCIIVILKNPSRATKDVSDKTVFNVTSYIYKNRDKYWQIKNVQTIIILNLIPFYQTYSDKFATSDINIVDKENLKTIQTFTSEYKKVIIAWGDHPNGLFKEYEQIKNSVFNILKTNKNQIFTVGKISKNGNPKHGQIWSYEDCLLPFN